MKIIITLLVIFFTMSYLNAQELYFPPKSGDEWETIDPEDLDWCTDELESFYTFLEQKNTKAYILLKDGKIVIEKYFNDFGPDSLWFWASAGKSLTSFLTGIAQEEGLINISDKTSDHLGIGWTAMDQNKEDLISIRHQLTMTTGLDNSLGDCLDPSCLDYKIDAGERWFYHNGPYTLLRKVIEAASGINYNLYTFQKLHSKTGMTGFWFWLGDTNLYLSKARSMARFGLLNLAKGKWDNTVVLGDMNYLNNMTQSSQNFNPSYGYLWWLNGKDSHRLPIFDISFDGEINEFAPADLYAGIGKNGQIVDIVPSLNLVSVRMGDNPDNSLVPVQFHRDLWEQLSKIICTTSSNNSIDITTSKISPNPFNDYIQISTSVELEMEFIIKDLFGNNLIKSKKPFLETSTLPSGIYILQTIQQGRSIFSQKVMKL